ncbi:MULTISPECIES: metallophosphoesterase family protein [Catenuloplanes]|uniref:Metallophosphoesterase n=1 Tax=Catenuloplanes niger TaxID=587534 RepID=A0AAE4CVR9_9ACTN|nr:metallophosphoesterase [Catenuloplanes niger]MDR7323084.1 hypothetical protein [Catenuloplanes niger]
MTVDPTEVPAEAQPRVRRRPASLDPRELGFTPQPPVPWLSPLLLINAGLRTLLAHLFGAYLDKREMQIALGPVPDHDHSDADELWIDYVADLGDGFDATYSIAYLLAQPELRPDGVDRPLPRGRLLVMGGDQVYPTASGEAYENRSKGPYEAALPVAPPDGVQPTLFAVPGNHDWYDGLTAFLRLFARRRDAKFGGWRTEQRRSYFAVKLPHGWWLLGLDEQAGSYIDDPQLEYFQDVADRIRPEDRIILAVPAPTWVKAADRPGAYDSVDYFVRKVLAPTGAPVRLMLSGDLHHYARYSGPDRELITCGGGGAYLVATHTLPETITVPPRDTLVRNASTPRDYTIKGRFPTVRESRRHLPGIFWRLPRNNPGFATFIGIVHTMLMLTMSGAVRGEESSPQLLTLPLGLMLCFVLGATIAFAKPPRIGQRGYAKHWLIGIAHGLAHLSAAALGTWAWLSSPLSTWEWQVVTAAVVYGPVAGFLGTELLALYLVIANFFTVNVNELFAGQGIDDAKSFLRMHLAADGTLTVYPIALRTVNRRWAAAPDAPEHSPWIVPATPLRPHLAEERPIRV